MSSVSLEEIVKRIQNGEGDLMLELWERTAAFVRARARSYFAAAPEPRRFELCDLEQQGYISLVYAVEHYDEQRGGFLGMLDLCLKTGFSTVAGIKHGRQANDAMNRACEGDAPLPSNPDGCMLDTIPAPGDAIAAAEDRLYVQQLHEALENAIGQLSRSEQKVIRGRYYDGQTGAQLGAALGCTSQNITLIERRALRALYAARRLSGLEQFIDARTSFYTPCGAQSFHRTSTSSVEAIVIRREQLRRRLLQNVFKDRRQYRPEKTDSEKVPG